MGNAARTIQYSGDRWGRLQRHDAAERRRSPVRSHRRLFPQEAARAHSATMRWRASRGVHLRRRERGGYSAAARQSSPTRSEAARDTRHSSDARTRQQSCDSTLTASQRRCGGKPMGPKTSLHRCAQRGRHAQVTGIGQRGRKTLRKKWYDGGRWRAEGNGRVQSNAVTDGWGPRNRCHNGG